jgi:uncharacterized protein
MSSAPRPSPSQQLSRLDPRAPLVVDTRELPRRAGSMRRTTRTVPAPPHLGLELLRVPEGSEVDLDLRLEAVVEGVLVSGTATVRLAGECGRCLDALAETLSVDLQQLFSYPGSEMPEDADTGRLDGDLLDLEPVVRDAVVLELPLTPLCDVDCLGLCPECGERREDLPDDHRHEAADPRWAALEALLPRDPDPQEDPRGRT